MRKRIEKNVVITSFGEAVHKTKYSCEYILDNLKFRGVNSHKNAANSVGTHKKKFIVVEILW